MSHPLALCFVIGIMGVLVSMTHIPHMPRCPFCGRTREHARDCSSRKH